MMIPTKILVPGQVAKIQFTFLLLLLQLNKTTLTFWQEST